MTFQREIGLYTYTIYNVTGNLAKLVEKIANSAEKNAEKNADLWLNYYEKADT